MSRKVRHMLREEIIKGFSYYDYVLPQEDAKRIFILKGGLGVGKSTFMQKLAKEWQHGFDTEYMHCSSDPIA